MDDELAEANSPWSRLREFTSARVALGRSGCGVPTAAHLQFQWDHARARDAVYSTLDAHRLCAELREIGLESLLLRSAAPDRRSYLQRPDLGRRLADESRAMIAENETTFDVAFIIADGLSSTAVNYHALPLLKCVLPGLMDTWRVGPVCVVEQARVAIGDEIGEALRAAMTVLLIGERPGLSAPDSLGIYLTWNPRIGTTDAARNCISNIRPEGLSYEVAAQKLLYLLTESRRRSLSGFELKEAAPTAFAVDIAAAHIAIDAPSSSDPVLPKLREK